MTVVTGLKSAGVSLLMAAALVYAQIIESPQL